MAKQQKIVEYSGLITLLTLIGVIALTTALGYSQVGAFNPPYLRLILNAVFISATNIFIAVVAVRSFMRHGRISFMFLSSALIVSGLAAFLSGWLSGNLQGTFIVFNVGFLISSILQAFGAVYLSAASPASKVYSNRKIVATLVLGLSIGSIVLTVAMSLSGLTPQFVMPDGSTTDLRQFVVGLSFIFFVLSSAVFAYQYFRSKARALYWYSLALALFAVDTFVSYNSAQLGDLLQWLGRLADYLGGVFFIIALLTLTKEAFAGAGFSERWFETFSNSRAQFAALFANMLSGFAYLRVIPGGGGSAVDAVFLEVNDAFEKHSGLKRADILGKRLTHLIRGIEEDPAGWIDLFGHVAFKGEPVNVERYMAGLGKWFRVSAYSPEHGYVAVLIEDVTGPRELQKALETYTKNLEATVEERTRELRQSERLAAIGQTAGMVGHDIRNPLQAITGDLFLIEQEVKTNPQCVSAEILESIGSINENVDYINKIVSDLQDYTRTLKPTIAPVKLKETINNALAGRKIPKAIAVEVSAVDLTIKTDSTFLRRIMTNLITNAIQAMPDGGKLTIDASQKDSTVLICIQDTGLGIPEQVKANLFKPLFTTKAKGQGLGLAVVKRLVESLNGKITFETHEGKGTKFTVELPIEQ